MRHIFALAVFAALLPFGAAAQSAVQSQEGITLENQILQLQQQVQQLQSSGGGGSNLGGSQPAPGDSSGGAPSSVVANLLTQVQQLQAQVQQLNGQVDTLQNQVNTQHDATEKEISDLNFKLGATPGAVVPGTAVPAAPTKPPPVAPPAAAAGSPKIALHAAQVAIVHGDYKTAESASRAVLANSKATPQGYQAQYILAQSLYGEGRPQDAAIAFDDTYNRNRTGDYAPGSLLGMANSLTAIHQEAAACDTLASLNSQFPSPPKNLVSAIAASSRRAHCS